MWENEFETEIHGTCAIFYEPLETNAPESACAYYCMIDLVILCEDGSFSKQIDRVTTKWNLLGARWTSEKIGFNALAPFVHHHDGKIYELTTGEAVWRENGWFMKWYASCTDPLLNMSIAPIAVSL